MKDKTKIWGVLSALCLLALLLLALPPVSHPRARAQRISTVNHVGVVSLTLTKTNALPPARQ